MVQPSAEQQQLNATDPALISRAREVGNEFVYIYYMSVNKCPWDLHRFYSSTSLFIHGGRDLPDQAQSPACGQSAIAERIASLKLFDCRTKILMVDSMPDSNGDGVLIQVCGEISNNAGPMRRFMQTFLLAPNGPKKYFVQRDIFRYQDEVFTDADADVSDVAMEPTAAAEPTVDGDATAAVPAAPVAVTTPPPPVSTVSPDEPPGLASPMAANGDGSIVAATGIDDAALVASGLAADQQQQPEQLQDAAASTVPKEMPAPIVSGGGGAGSSSAGAAVGVKKNFAALFGGGSVAAPQPPPPPPPPAQPAPQQQRKQAAQVPTNGQAKAEPQWGQEQDVPDNQQVFVGNIGPNISEDDLIEEFSQFGEVVSCRINSNRSRPPGSVGFGFISFADPAVARKLIDMKRHTSSHGTTLNLEEKKSSGRRGGGGGGGGGFGGRSGGGAGSYGRGGRGPSRR
ncbi:hypothetical protein BOX15_Mlig000803g2 [Macrostomum lignano]|uniref:NTF2 domain-containing protein n=1 Tax=Macrostomum lignano TaxID=282301 RepID=A0A267G2G5_9PLAT|nr:hypothetical protein BOX15_Mlig000803g2 [Macrostomum lignano]